jgi:uncharacterized iron-regulated membrane protein
MSAMSAEMLQNLALACAVIGLGCFMWPALRRLKGGEPPASAQAALRSPAWWAGLLFTALGAVLLGFASGAG